MESYANLPSVDGTERRSSASQKHPPTQHVEDTRDMEPTDRTLEEKSPAGEATEREGIIVRDWTDEEEKRVKFKLDFIVLALLMTGLFSLQLDKGNIAYAKTTTFVEDVGLEPNEVNWGIALQSTGIIVFEIPFNMVLSHVGPSLWLTIQIFAWSIISTAQAALHNRAGWYASRFMLGVWEAGYLAGSLTILSSFYTRKEMAMRVSLVYIGNYFSQGVGALIAAAIFTIPDGTHGLQRWQWLFIINGVFGFLVGGLFIMLMPRSNLNTLPLCNWKRLDAFNARERHILDSRVLLDDPRKNVRLSGIGLKRLLRILLNWPIWAHFAVNVVTMIPKGGLQIYSPTIIENLGFENVKANALASVGSYGVCILSIFASWISDKTGYRGPVCIACSSFALLFSGLQYGYVYSDNQWLKYAIFTLLYSGNAIGQAINDAWLSSNIHDAQVRCVGLALAVAGSNTAGITGQYLFLENDAPYYPKGFMKILCIYSASIVLITLLLCMYTWENIKMVRQNGSGQVVDRRGLEEMPADVTGVKVKNQL